MNTEQAEYMRRDTLYVLNYEYDRVTVLGGFGGCESPIFDSLAADRFASDREIPAQNPFVPEEYTDCNYCEAEYNLGDYR